MKLLDKYIAKTVISSILLVILLLSGLQIFILFVNQLPDLGRADYDIFALLSYVFLDLPYEVYLFFPMASLLGCLIGLGTMANNHELVIMRASGKSIGQISWAIIKVALILILIVTFVGENIMPRWVKQAHKQKSQALSGGQTLETPHGIWVRYKNDFIKIGEISANQTLNDVNQFHFNLKHELQYSRHINQLRPINRREWQAHGVVETWISNSGTQKHTYESIHWNIPLAWSILGVSQRQLDEMTLYELYQSIHEQKNMSHSNEKLIYFQRIMQPITTLVMMLLAIPFIFGPLRSSTMGSKLLTGAAVGFSFYIINKFLGSASQVYQWSSLLAAVGPTCVCAFLGIWLMRRAI